MPFNGEPSAYPCAPVALAAVTVDGRCRERSPADLALFGPRGDRLIERFSDAATGQDLFVRATADGAAEGVAELQTTAGPMRFQISLWRQRGGEKIRILAAFAQIAEPSESEPSLEASIPATDRAEPGSLALLQWPVAAMVGLAERVRAEAPESLDRTTSDLLTAAFRVRHLAANLRTPPCDSVPCWAEIDLARLARRIARLAAIALREEEIDVRCQTNGATPFILGDEGLLWSLMDHLIVSARAHTPRGGHLTIAISNGRTGPQRRPPHRGVRGRCAGSGRTSPQLTGWRPPSPQASRPEMNRGRMRSKSPFPPAAPSLRSDANEDARLDARAFRSAVP